MEIAYLNGEYLPKDELRISPDDRGFLFAEGVYEVVKWYQGFFYDMESHLARLKGSLRKTLIDWPGEDSFPAIARELIIKNDLLNKSALVYFQVTRGVAVRKHAFPVPPVSPTLYGFARDFVSENEDNESGIGVMLKEDIRWKRCDIKSIALLANTLSYQEALDNGFRECAFVRDGKITECTHSNIFFSVDGVLYTHPESENILSGITRKNILRIAKKSGLTVIEEAVTTKMVPSVSEAFVTNTSGEIIPVTRLDGNILGNGEPGPMTRILKEKFNDEICHLKHS
jgi:D-alanine transaminase